MTAGLAGAMVASTLAGSVPAGAQTAAESARNVRICHGDALPCEVQRQIQEAGDQHLVTVLVTDASGAPVGGVPVELRESGEGRFTTGSDSVVVTTAADGRATAVVTADGLGSSQLWAEMSPPGTAGGFRGPAADDDECEQPAGPSGEPPGNCIAGPIAVDWEVPPDPPECSDGIDNDADGDTDVDDPSCFSEHDPTEATTDPVDERYERTVTLAFSEWSRDRVVVFGRVEVAAAVAECIEGVPVRIHRRSGGGWTRAATVSTSRTGWYVVVLPDLAGRYRATALRHVAVPPDGSYVVCDRAARKAPST